MTVRQEIVGFHATEMHNKWNIESLANIQLRSVLSLVSSHGHTIDQLETKAAISAEL